MVSDDWHVLEKIMHSAMTIIAPFQWSLFNMEHIVKEMSVA